MCRLWNDLDDILYPRGIKDEVIKKWFSDFQTFSVTHLQLFLFQ